MWVRSTWNNLLKQIILSGFICLSVYASPLKPHPVYDFSKGLDTYHSSLSLPDGFVHNSSNVLFDSQAPISKRQGYTVAFTTKSYAGQTAWTYTDSTNTSWIIVRTSDSIVANSLSGTSTVLVSTVSSNNLVGEVNAFGNAYFVDQTQGVYYWNGSTTVYVSGSPKGSLVTQWHGRVWVSGLAVPNGNLLYGSKQYDGTTWATGLNPNDPVILTVGLQDNFDTISALYPFIDTLYTFKHTLTYAVYGFDQTSFQISFITSECGCIDQQSIQTFGASLKFVSQRGVETFDGYSCTRISDPIKNLVDPAIQSQGGANIQSWVQQSASDWNAGTFISTGTLNTTLASPALSLSTGSLSDSAATFSQGTFSNTQTFANGVEISTSASAITNPGFEGTCNSSGCSGWDFSQGGITGVSSADSASCGTFTPHGGSQFMSDVLGQSNAVVSFIDGISSATLASVTINSGSTNCSWTLSTISMSGVDRRYGRIKIHHANDWYSDFFVSNGTDIQFYFSSGFSASGVTWRVLYDDFGGTFPKSTTTSGTFTSRVFDTGFSSSALSVAVSSTSFTEPVTFVLQHSASSGGPFTDLTTSQNTSVMSNRYVRYISTFTLGASDTAKSYLNGFSGAFTVTPGSIKSQSHPLSGATSFGNFSAVSSLNGGAISFSVCASSSSDMIPSICSAQAANAQISISTNSYVNWYATFTVTAATQAPALNSATVQWFSGNRSSPMSSTVWDNRYWLSLTTTTADSANDAILVLSTKGSWSLYDIHAGGLVQYKNNLYHTDSLSSGNTYLDNQGYADNGSAINAFIQSKDYCEEGPTQEDYYESLYPSMDNLGNYNMSISYQMDRDPTMYSLSSVNQSEFSNNSSVKIPFVLTGSNQNFGKCIRFTFAESDLNSPWNFYGWTSYFHERDVQ